MSGSVTLSMNTVLFFAIMLLLIWICLTFLVLGVLRLGKKSDTNSMKFLIGTDDEELAKAFVQITEDNEQAGALERWRKDKDQKSGEPDDR